LVLLYFAVSLQPNCDIIPKEFHNGEKT